MTDKFRAVATSAWFTAESRKRSQQDNKPKNKMNTISAIEAKSKGMKPLTMPGAQDSIFIQNVVKDMKSIPSTVWSLVNAGQGLVAVWRVPCAQTIR